MANNIPINNVSSSIRTAISENPYTANGRSYLTPVTPQNAIPAAELARLGPETRSAEQIDAILDGVSPIGYGENQVDPRLASAAGIGPTLAGSAPSSNSPSAGVASSPGSNLANTPARSSVETRPWRAISTLQDRYDFIRGLKVFNISPDGPPGSGGGSGPRQAGGTENVVGSFIPLPLPQLSGSSDPSTSSESSSGGGGVGSVLDGGSADGVGTVNGPGAGSTAGYNGSNGRLDPNQLTSIGSGHSLREDAAAAYNSMAEAAAQDGIQWSITDSYRTYETQVRLAEEKGLYSQGGLAATPGTSNHGWGMALDLGGGANRNGTPENNWLRENANRFGFYTIPREPWHWEFRG